MNSKDLEINVETLSIKNKLLIFIPIILFFVFGSFRGAIWLINDVILGIMLLKLISHKIRLYKIEVFLIYLLLIFLLANSLMNGITKIFFVRIYDVFKGLIVLAFINSLYVNQRKAVEKFVLHDVFCFFNIYFFVNLLIIIYQINAGTDRDHISGLIGENGTHQMLAIWLLLLVINIIKIKTIKRKKIKYLIIIIFIFEFATMLIISAYSDNTAFYFLGPYFIFISNFSTLKFRKVFNIRTIIIATVLIFVAINIVNKNSYVNEWYQRRVVVKYYQLNYLNDNRTISDEERTEMIKYAINESKNVVFGNGLGIRTEIFGIEGKEYGYYPVHLIMNSMAPFIYEGGIVFLLLTFIIYYYYSSRFIVTKKAKIVVAINIIVLSFYTTFIVDERLMSIYPLINLSLYLNLCKFTDKE